MRRLLKILLFLVVVVVVVALAGVGFLYARYPNVPDPENITVQATPEKIARGKYLSDHVSGCTDCHAVRDMTKYGGPVKPETYGAGGEFFGDSPIRKDRSRFTARTSRPRASGIGRMGS